MDTRDFSELTPEIVALAEQTRQASKIDPALYDKYSVKRGLRDIGGNGVLTGLTEISEIIEAAGRNARSVRRRAVLSRNKCRRAYRRLCGGQSFRL